MESTYQEFKDEFERNFKNQTMKYRIHPDNGNTSIALTSKFYEKTIDDMEDFLDYCDNDSKANEIMKQKLAICKGFNEIIKDTIIQTIKDTAKSSLDETMESLDSYINEEGLNESIDIFANDFYSNGNLDDAFQNAFIDYFTMY